MMKLTRKNVITALGVTMAAGLVFVGDADAHCGACGTSADKTASTSTIPEVAKAAGQFQTLLAAVEAAGLSDTLAGKGPFTVFAPTDEAFARLPEGTVEGLLGQPEKLKAVLLHHVLPAEVEAEKVVAATSLTTAFGQPVTVEVGEAGVKIGGARVMQTDIAASNGVIHVIDHVLLPKDLVGVAASTSNFSTLVAAVTEAGLIDVLQGNGPFTVFAPNNAAFAKLPPGTVEDLLKPENRVKLQAILKYHVVPGDFRAADVVKLTTAETAHGGSLRISNSENEGVRVNQAKVLQTDIVATNGVIHVIDSVMLPAG